MISEGSTASVDFSSLPPPQPSLTSFLTLTPLRHNERLKDHKLQL